MTDNVANYHQLVSLAQDVLTLARNTLLVNLRFLDLALSQFRYKDYPSTLSTDGNILFFDPYYVLSAYKVDKAHSGKGSGLGLSIAKELLNRMDEQIWVESEKGVGSVFSFTVHRNPPAAEEQES